MFSKFFNPKQETKAADGTDYLKIFKSIFEFYEQDDEFNYRTKVIGTEGFCELNYYLIPNAFDLENQLIPNGISTYEDLYAIIAPKINFSTVEPNYFDENSINFLHLFFKTSHPENKFQWIDHDFLIFCGYQDSDEINVYEVLYSSQFDADFIDFWQKAEPCSLILPINSDHAEALEKIEDVLLGLCQTMGIPHLDKMFKDATKEVYYEVNEQLYANLLKLINPLTDESEVLHRAKKLHQKLVVDEMEDEGDNADLLLEFYWQSDWKFEFEDLEDFIASAVEQPLQIEIPEDTYSADLFPYIQLYLKQNGKILMNYNSFGDSYFFFIIDVKDVDEVINQAYFAGIHLEVAE
ncbi:hypothetical protein OBK28_11095 [Empedobacter falsenii]|uniref:DUF6630 domain-containing protein n=1 Tax=Empedobacter falsenii TaxID=343874 RepID=A0ABY8V8J4_9FLAO|nr:hypothetical protein [Empedobacter falsenii]WIH96623.1 hypothetical protein OBA43_10155 [Empedobacter falsenii]